MQTLPFPFGSPAVRDATVREAETFLASMPTPVGRVETKERATFEKHFAKIAEGDRLLGCFLVGSGMIGLAIVKKTGYEASVTICVEESYRRQGIGKILFHRASLAARNLGAESLKADYVPGNYAMERLAAREGMWIRMSDDVRQASITLVKRDPFSIAFDWMLGLQGFSPAYLR